MSLISTKKVDTNVVELQIAVSEEQLQAATLTAYKKNVSKITLPGFRKGKAPKGMIEKMYGKDFFYEDAVNAIYPEAYEAAVAEAGIDPVDQAAVDNLEFKDGEGFTFRATVTVKPEVEVSDYKGIKAEKNVETIMAADVNAELDKLRERNARLVTADRAAKKDDTATIDFEGFREGVAFEGGKGEDYPLVLGSGSFIPGFEEQVIGHKAGESFDVNVTFPEEYHVEELGGQPATFKVTIKNLQKKELPVLDDEFAKDVSEFDTLADLKKDLKEKLQSAKDEEAQQEVEQQLIDAVIANLKAEIPACMIDHKANELLNDFAYRLQSQGLSLDMYTQYTGTNLDTLKDSFKGNAERQVKIRLAMEKIAELEGVSVTMDEIDAEYKRLAGMYGLEEAKVREFIPASDVEQDLFITKAIDIVRNSADITVNKVKKSAKKKDEAEESEEK